jgi:NhaP-type Na+/H+ or K+/H+ antiporter
MSAALLFLAGPGCAIRNAPPGEVWIMALIAIFVILLFLYVLISRRLDETIVTAPMIFTFTGMLMWFAAPDLHGWELNRRAFLVTAEVGLVLLLFTDASRTRWSVIENTRHLCLRLLSAGMLLTIGLGVLTAMLVFRSISLWEAGILAAILAPTDPCLGQIIINSPRVPMRIRQALNVEAGLNDGLSVPFLLFFIALGGAATEGGSAHLVRFVVQQLGLGSFVGIGIGLLGGWLLGIAHRKEWMAPSLQQLGVVVLPLLCAMASEVLGASMFIAAFVAGFAVQAGFQDVGKQSVEFSDKWGQLLNLFIFFIFGVLAAQACSQFNLPGLLYAVLSLTVVRMLPVAISLIGTRLSAATVLFMGWFGPRGLGSIVLGMVSLERVSYRPDEPVVRIAVVTTVLLSILAHGLSAAPGTSVYVRRIAGLPSDAPEHAGRD